MSKVTIFRVIHPKDTSHTHIFKVPQTKIRYPHILGHKSGKGNVIVDKHFFHCLYGNLLLKYAVLVEIGICVLFQISHSFICYY